MKKNGWKKVKTIKRYEKVRNKPYSDAIRENLLKAIETLGISKNSIMAESDPVKLRLYLSELIIHRKFCQSISSEDFISMCIFFLCVIETCEEDISKLEKGYKKKTAKKTVKKPEQEQKTTKENGNGNKNLTEDSLTLAYYLSRFDAAALKELGYSRFKDAFESVGAMLNQKASTIKNMRDEFDPYFDNGRRGWYQRTLSASRKEVFDKFAEESFGEITIIVKNILAKYKEAQSKQEKREESVRRTIKISNSNMKEIKPKKI